MNYTTIFYWLTVADNAKTFFVVFVCIFTFLAFISSLGYLFNLGDSKESPEDRRVATKWMFWSYPFMIFFWSLYIFTPSQKDALFIIAGGATANYLANDSISKQIPHKVLQFVDVKLEQFAEEADVKLNVNSQKNKILEEAKNMTGEELINKIKNDSTFAKIITDK